MTWGGGRVVIIPDHSMGVNCVLGVAKTPT